MWVSLPESMFFRIIEHLENEIAIYGEDRELQEIIDRLKEGQELCNTENEELVRFRSVAALLMEQDDVVKVEENAPVSVGDEGADVLIWAHIRDDEVKELLADALEEQGIK